MIFTASSRRGLSSGESEGLGIEHILIVVHIRIVLEFLEISLEIVVQSEDFGPQRPAAGGDSLPGAGFLEIGPEEVGSDSPGPRRRNETGNDSTSTHFREDSGVEIG